MQIVDRLRADIASGALPPGARLPSRPEMMKQFGVSDGTAARVARTLISEGLAIAKDGSGTYVRERPELTRLVRTWYSQLQAGSPFMNSMLAQGRTGSWDYNSRTVQAPPEIRARLGLAAPGDDQPDVMCTDYLFKADGIPVMLSTSWEPLSMTRGTAIVVPEEGPHGGRGVVERLLAIGVRIDGFVETVGGRAGTAEECARLRQSPGAMMLTIARSYPAGDRVVEVADIVLPADTFQLVYSGPVGES